MNWESLLSVPMKWWLGFLESFVTLQLVGITFVVVSVVSLFFILRYEQITYGKMWVWEEVELVIAGACGAIFILCVTAIPVMVLSAIVGAVLYVLLAGLSWLVKFSVRS